MAEEGCELPAEEIEAEEDEEGEENAGDTSVCDASFSAADSVPTSGHDRLSRCTEEVSQFLSCVEDHLSKSEDFDFEESLGILTIDELAALWMSLLSYLKSRSPPTAELVCGTALVGKLCTSLELVVAEGPPPALQEAAHHLYSLLPGLDSKCGQAVVRMMEAWYTGELPEKESLAEHTLAFLLGSSLKDGATKADLKRVWALHQAVLGLSLDRQDSLTKLLESTVESRLYLTTAEGQRWLTFLFSLSVEMVTVLHTKAKAALARMVSCKTAWTGLGEVYYRAWLTSGGEFRNKLEQGCIQDFMYLGIVCPRTMAVSTLRLLSSIFIKTSHSAPTACMVHSLLEPILWRHLKVPNPIVRQNAAEMFLEAYPVEDRSLNREERDDQITMQHTVMKTLLADESPAVRASAVAGVANILAQYWLLIPSHFINELVKYIVKELSCDSSSATVRLASVKAMQTLLSAPDSHVYMKKVLPRLADRLHDTKLAVRGAMLELLLAVKGVRSIRFWDVVTLDALLARLEVDKAFICRRISKLLFKSYCPSNTDEEAILERCIHLVGRSRAASRKFYQYAEIEVREAVRLMAAILSSVRQWVRDKPQASGELDHEQEERDTGGKEKGKNKKEQVKEKETGKAKKRKLGPSVMDETGSSLSGCSVMTPSPQVKNKQDGEPAKEEGEDEEEHPYENQDVVWGVLDVVCVLWMKHNEELCREENGEVRTVLEKKAIKCVLLLFKYFRGSPVCGTVTYLASFLPDRVVSPLASYCVTVVRKADDDWRGCVDSLCNWKRGDSLLELVLEGFRSGLKGKEAGGQARGVRFAETQSKEEGLEQGVRLMEYILSNPINRAFVLAKCSQQLEEVLELCTKVTSIVEEKLETKASIQEGESRLLPKVLQLVGTLSVLLSKTPLVRLEELLAWSERELCAVTSHSVEVTFSRMQVSLAQECLSAVASLGSTCLMLDLADPEFTEKLLDWSGQLLDQEDESQISTVMGVLVEAGTRALYSKSEAWKAIYNDKVLVAFAKVLSWLSHAGSGLEEGGEGAEALSKGVGALMKLYSKEAEYQAESWEDLVEVLLEMVIKVVTQEVEETGRVEMPTVLAQIGCIPAILLKAVLSAGGEGLLGQYLLENLKTEDDKNKEDDDEEEDEPLTGSKIAAIFMINTALKMKRINEIQQEIENVIASRLLVDDVSDEEREMLDRVMTRLVEARDDANHADVA